MHLFLSCHVSVLSVLPAHLYPTISTHKSMCLYWSNVPVTSNTVPCLFQSQIFISPECLTGLFPHCDKNVSPSSNHFNVCLQSTDKEREAEEWVCVLVFFFSACEWSIGTDLSGVSLRGCAWIAAHCLQGPPYTFSPEMRQENKAHECEVGRYSSSYIYTPLMDTEEREWSWSTGDANMLGSACWRRGRIKYTGKASSRRLGCDERERSASEKREWATGTAR